jgi:uncharacterized lipoprotein YddW (UPF0748 family)
MLHRPFGASQLSLLSTYRAKRSFNLSLTVDPGEPLILREAPLKPRRALIIARCLLAVLLQLVLMVLPGSCASADPDSIRFGLWAEVEGRQRIFDTKDQLEEFLFFVQAGRFTDVYCQVFRSGKSWFPSPMADDSPYREALSNSYDPLRETIDAAHREGKKVHAWINVLRVNDNRQAAVLQLVGQRGILIDSTGHSLLDYEQDMIHPVLRLARLDTAGIWLDPSSPVVRRYYVELISDIILQYPDLDGIHLDMIRYPFATGLARGQRLDFGYHPEALASFARARGARKGSTINPRLGEAAPAWDNWRRSQLTLMVFEIKELLNRLAPQMELSVAAIAWPDRAQLHALQEWPSWLAAGAVDTAIPMAYTVGTSDFRNLSRLAFINSGGRSTLMGIGAWLLVNYPEVAVEQARSAVRYGNQGIVLFSYANLHSKPGLKLVDRVSSLLLAPVKHVQ